MEGLGVSLFSRVLRQLSRDELFQRGGECLGCRHVCKTGDAATWLGTWVSLAACASHASFVRTIIYICTCFPVHGSTQRNLHSSVPIVACNDACAMWRTFCNLSYQRCVSVVNHLSDCCIHPTRHSFNRCFRHTPPFCFHSSPQLCKRYQT